MNEKIYGWIADYNEGSINKGDFRRLREWVMESPEHQKIFEDCIRIYRESRELGFMIQMEPRASWEMLERKLKKRSRRKVMGFVAAASILFGGIIGGWLVWSSYSVKEVMPVASVVPGKATVMLLMADNKRVCLKNHEVLGLVEKDGTELRKDTTNGLVYKAGDRVAESVSHTIKVPVGGEFDLTLADGTRIWLNSDTELRFPTRFSGSAREVFVTGEAFFSVEKDSEHPFIVHTDGIQIRVTGTEFNLSAYPGERMTTTLVRGKVEVTDGRNRVDLQPGEQAVWSGRVKSMEVKNVDVALYLSWMKGVFEFENMSLLEITNQLSRWYGVIFEFEDACCAERYFTGGIKKYVPLSQSLDILEKTTNVVFKIKDNVILVKSR